MKTRRLIQRLLIVVGIAACVEMYLFASKTVMTESDQYQSSPQQQQTPTLDVTHHLMANQLHLQLKISSFTFSLENMGKENRYGEGHVHLYVDGKKVAKIFEQQFVLKEIASGKHDVIVELAHNNHDSYGVKKAFEITVK